MSSHYSDSRLRPTPLRAALPAAATNPALPLEEPLSPVSPLLRWTFYLFVFSIPFETANTLIGVHDLSLAKVTGFFFMAVALLNFQVCFARPPRAVWYFAAYLLVMTIAGLLQTDQYQAEFRHRLSQLVQLWILLWISWSILRRDDVAWGMLRSLVAACVSLAVLQKLGITSMRVETSLGDRISALGENLNTIGALMSIAFLSVLGLAYERKQSQDGSPLFRIAERLATWPCGIIVGLSMILTGSRGALVAFAAGMLTWLWRKGRWQDKARNALIIFAALALCLWFSAQSQAVWVRWQLTIEKGYYAHRDEYTLATWRMFMEKPLFGWGPAHHLYELGNRINKELSDTHNLYTWILTEVGLCGAIPFFAGLWECLKSAWRGRFGTRGVLPLSLTICWLVMNLTGTFHNRKLHWLILAYALSSGAVLLAPRAAPPDAEWKRDERGGERRRRAYANR